MIARETAYHGTTMGALIATGITAVRAPVRAAVRPAAATSPNTNLYRLPHGSAPTTSRRRSATASCSRAPRPSSAVILEPVQNSGGCFTPPEGYFQRVREICDEFDVAASSPTRSSARWGRLGTYFGAERYDYQPDIITTAKGITSSYAPMGAVIASDRVFEPFSQGTTIVHARHHLRRAPDRRPRSRWRTSTSSSSEGILEHVREHEGAFRGDARRRCATSRSSATCAAPATSRPIELVKDRETKADVHHEESETLLRGYLSAELFDRGLICRADDRGDPVIQLSPPLIAGPEQFEEIEAVLRPVLEEASRADAPRQLSDARC